MIAYCGLDCSKCDAYLATLENSDIKRMETARKWSKMLRHKIKPEQNSGTKSRGNVGRRKIIKNGRLPGGLVPPFCDQE